MFTGIVELMGRVRRAPPGPLEVEAPIALAPGESIAVDGCCLTVVASGQGYFAVLPVAETLRRTTLGRRRPGDLVNLERPVAAGGRLGGHIVQGHVDGTGRVLARVPEGEAEMFTFAAPPEVMAYVVPKGSIAVDGVSLTVVDRTADAFRVAVIPYTRQATTLGLRQVGDLVNLEADVVAKYVAQFIRPYGAMER